MTRIFPLTETKHRCLGQMTDALFPLKVFVRTVSWSGGVLVYGKFPQMCDKTKHFIHLHIIIYNNNNICSYTILIKSFYTRNAALKPPVK